MCLTIKETLLYSPDVGNLDHYIIQFQCICRSYVYFITLRISKVYPYLTISITCSLYSSLDTFQLLVQYNISRDVVLKIAYTNMNMYYSVM
jgi:hypothetical protein